MPKILKIKNANDYSRYVGLKDKHPLVSVVEYADVLPVRSSLNNYEVYALFMLRYIDVELKYGCGKYDYQDGTLIFVAPGQTFGAEDDGKVFQPTGYLLMFHPDLFRNTPLGKVMKDYTFFSYETNEALHLSTEERQIIMNCFHKIQYELSHAIDRYSKALIVDSIKMFLIKLICMDFIFYPEALKNPHRICLHDTKSHHMERFRQEGMRCILRRRSCLQPPLRYAR